VQADGKAGAECGERGFGRIGRGVVAQQARRFVDDVGREVADVVGVAELALGHRLAFQRLDHLRVGLAVGDQLLEPAFVDGGKATGQDCFLCDRGHQFLSLGARIPNGLFPARSVPEAAVSRKFKRSKRLSCVACRLISGTLPIADAIAACSRDSFGRFPDAA
jgi:hypothetical protein